MPHASPSTLRPQASLDQLYLEHRRPLIGFIYEKVGSRDLAEDILHDLFLNIWSRIDRWEVRGDMRTYLFSAARNHVWSHYSKQRVRRAHAEAERSDHAASGVGREPEAVRHLEAEALDTAMARWIAELPDRRREVFELSRYGHLTYQEIADRLGVSVKTVETQMSRSLRHLRERLAAFEAD
ncbi:RNA polymerase sigma factor [Rubrivirga sp.]|uniref:RNA polymerase sigma factor n=1 Tax=Rubrivirga sp. TaxID=1885344 RepID=UPI003B527EBF